MRRWVTRAALAIVLVILIVTRIAHRSHSQGLAVRLVTTECGETEENFRGILLRVGEDGRTQINSDHVSRRDVPLLLRHIYSTRPRRLLFFEAEASTSYQDAITVLADSQSAIEGLSVVLVTPSVRKQCEWRWAPAY
jgi:biopolymer transport protein ExbD